MEKIEEQGKEIDIQKIKELCGDIYEVGYAHGSNAFRMATGKPPKDTNKGWGIYFSQIRDLLLPSKPESQEGE